MPTIKMKVNGQWVYVDNGVNSQLTEALEEINDQLEAFALEEDTNLLQGGTYLGSGTDLWNITTVGNYYCNDSVAAMSMSHCPTAYGFSLKVTSGTGEKIIQGQNYQYLRYELKPFDANSAYVYYADAKTTNGGTSWTWSEWKKITDFTSVEIGSAQVVMEDGSRLNTTIDSIQSNLTEISNKANATMPKSGGNFTGAVHFTGGAGNVDIFSDNEGGNIVINSPTENGDSWQMDSYNGNFRIFHGDNSQEIDHSLTVDKNGVIHPTGGYGGGVFMGDVSASAANRSGAPFRNIAVKSSSSGVSGNAESTDTIIMVRK